MIQLWYIPSSVDTKNVHTVYAWNNKHAHNMFNTKRVQHTTWLWEMLLKEIISKRYFNWPFTVDHCSTTDVTNALVCTFLFAKWHIQNISYCLLEVVYEAVVEGWEGFLLCYLTLWLHSCFYTDVNFLGGYSN